MQDFGVFQTDHPELKEALKVATNIAKGGASILISGPPGSGKRTMLRYITDRAGVHPNRIMRFEIDKTWDDQYELLIVENVDDLTVTHQLHLLNLIESIRAHSRKIRIITTAKSDLVNNMKTGAFIQELYYKIAVISIQVPSLRERDTDISGLSKLIADVCCVLKGEPKKTLTVEALAKLQSHAWPGNVAELENVIERAVYLSEGDQITEDVILFSETNQPPAISFKVGLTLHEMERKLILQTLKITQQNRTKAAEILGISIRTLRNKINEYKELGVI